MKNVYPEGVHMFRLASSSNILPVDHPIIIATLFLINITVTPLSAQNDFDSYLEEQRALFSNYSDFVTAQYEDYLAVEQAAHAAFRQEMIELWGDFRESTNKEWIEFSQDRTARTSVDFETGEITIEVITDDYLVFISADVNQKLEDTIVQLTESTARTNEFPVGRDAPKAIMKKPILDGQLKTKAGDAVNGNNNKVFAKEIVNDAQQSTTTIKGKDNKERTKVTIRFALVPDHMKIRANRFKTLVDKYARKYELDASLIYAIIHTESAFNPAARSPVPAFGLMQLVPTAGARDAYNYVYKQDKLVTRKFLFKPENNIELGTAYVHIIGNRYLNKITNPESRLYCMIASYNTGVGNMCRTFTGKTKIRPAVDQINQLSPEKVYLQLRQSLPHNETKVYIKNVSDRMALYQ